MFYLGELDGAIPSSYAPITCIGFRNIVPIKRVGSLKVGFYHSMCSCVCFGCKVIQEFLWTNLNTRGVYDMRYVIWLLFGVHWHLVSRESLRY